MNRFKRYLAMSVTVVLVLILSTGTALAAFDAEAIPGWTGPYPSNAIKFQNQGCNIKPDDGTYDLAGDVLRCDEGNYTNGNLGKNWHELDLVPFWVTSDSAGLDPGEEETFQFVIGGDYLSKGNYGYDQIFDFELTAGNCEWDLVGSYQVGSFDGSADQQIVQILEVTQPADTICRWDYVQRLALGSAANSGSSLHSFYVVDSGLKTIPIPDIVTPISVNKEMTAVRNGKVNWTVAKEATPVELNFGDTCDPDNTTRSKDVTINITFTKGPTVGDSVVATAQISIVNPSFRVIEFDCTDKLYSGTTLLSTESETETYGPGDYTMFIEHEVAASATGLNNQLSCVLSVDDDPTHSPDQFNDEVGTLTATFSLPDSEIADGTIINDSITVKDLEQITGEEFSFSAATPTGSGTPGVYANYTAGASRTAANDPIEWNSTGTINQSGSIQFVKTVTVTPFTNATGSLSDQVEIPLTDYANATASAATTLVTSALVSINIAKTIPDILQGEDSVTCSFSVKDSQDAEVATKDLVFTAGETSKQATVDGLMPGTYTVVETACSGLYPDDDDYDKSVVLTLVGATSTDDCADTVTFANVYDHAVVEVNKITNPAGFEDGWDFVLKGPGLPTEGLTLTTADGDNTAFERFQVTVESELVDFKLQEGAYTITETPKAGWKTPPQTSGDCQFTVDYPADIGSTFQCTFTNEKLGTIIIRKETDPVGGTGFGFTDNIKAPNSFSLDDAQEKTFTEVVAGTYTVTENDPTPDFDLVDLVCVDDFTEAGYNLETSSVNKSTRVATIKLDPGETVKCTYTNRERGMVNVLKLTQGVASPTAAWNFSLNGPQVSATDATPPALVDFNGAKLIPGEEYTLCETGIPAGWTSEWKIDTNGDGTPDTIIPMVAGVNDDPVNPTTGYSRVYDPNYVALPATYTNDTRCVNFVVDAGETLAFEIDNRYPGGEPRTIGYWKNWNTCTGGNQAATAAANGGPAQGWYLLNDLLNNPGFTIGILVLDGSDCEDAVSILNKSDISNGKKMASDAAYNMAAQLLAAQLNLSAGAETCQAVVDAVNAGQTLLAGIGFDGSGNFLRPKNPLYEQANVIAATLDMYNNGMLCQ